VSEKKPVVMSFPPVQKFCPVCGKVSYSLSGEHPQCAVARGDARIKARQKKQGARKQAIAVYKPLPTAKR
jgi:hypothetical protein